MSFAPCYIVGIVAMVVLIAEGRGVLGGADGRGGEFSPCFIPGSPGRKSS
jgi:hypothetical protein